MSNKPRLTIPVTESLETRCLTWSSEEEQTKTWSHTSVRTDSHRLEVLTLTHTHTPPTV